MLLCRYAATQRVIVSATLLGTAPCGHQPHLPVLSPRSPVVPASPRQPAADHHPPALLRHHDRPTAGGRARGDRDPGLRRGPGQPWLHRVPVRCGVVLSSHVDLHNAGTPPPIFALFFLLQCSAAAGIARTGREGGSLFWCFWCYFRRSRVTEKGTPPPWVSRFSRTTRIFRMSYL